MPFERTCQVDQDLWLQRGGRACLVVVSQRQSISLTEHAEHAEKGGLESQRQKHIQNQSTQRKAGWKVNVKRFLSQSTQRKAGWKVNVKSFSHRVRRARGERRV